MRVAASFNSTQQSNTVHNLLCMTIILIVLILLLIYYGHVGPIMECSQCPTLLSGSDITINLAELLLPCPCLVHKALSIGPLPQFSIVARTFPRESGTC